MIRPAILAATVALSPAVASAQSAAELEGMIDLGIEAMGSGGADITIGRRSVEDGNVLLLEDIRLTGDEDEPVVTTDWIRIAPLSELPGNVRITVAPEIRMDAPIEDFDQPTVFIFENDALAVTTNLITGAIGQPEATLTADRFALRAGGVDHPMIRHLNVAFEDIAADFSFNEASRSGDGSFAIARMIADYDITDPNGARMTMRSNSDAIELDFSGTNLQEGELEMADFIAGGGSLSLSMSSGPSETSFASDSPDFPMTVDASSGAGTFDMSFGAGGFDMGWDIGTIIYNIAPGEGAPLPIPPFEVGLGGSDLRITMPVLPEDTPRRSVMRMTLEDLTMGEGLWSLFDPAQTIPRDPLNLDIDLSSMVKLFIPLDQAEDGASPLELGEFDDIRIAALNASGGGASVTASGAVDMDYAAGFPMPAGQIDIAIKGVQGLGQALVNLGLVDQMQVGMMMGGIMAFSKPGDEADSFTSVIEFRDGQVFANGAPIPIQ